MSIKKINLYMLFTLAMSIILLADSAHCQTDENTRNVLKQGLVGAGAGALAAGTSGGNAGQGALVGAGTTVIGSALLDTITGPSTPSRPSSSSYRRSAPPPPDDDYYYEDQPEEYYEEPPQESSSSKILKQGLVGAGAGALAAGTSGGDAGKGALIGAGTTVIGSALLDAITAPPQQPKRVYRKAPQPQSAPVYKKQNVQVKQEEMTDPEGGRKKVIKKYDESGKLIQEEEVYY